MTSPSKIVASAEARERDARWAEWEAGSIAHDRAARRRAWTVALLVAVVTVAILLLR